MNPWRMIVVARKEFTDSFRDRRVFLNIALSALFGPFLISFMLSQIARQNKAAEEIQVPVAGRERAPLLVDWLAQQSGVEIVAAPGDPEAAVRDQKAELVLVIDPEFARKFSAARPAPVHVLSDSTRQSAAPKVERLKVLLRQFSSQMGGLRLVARGVSPAVASVLDVEEVNVANSQKRAAMMLKVILVFLVIAVMTTGMQIATDSTAGERERGSLEPLLLNPVPRWQLAGGKWLAAAAASFIGLVATLVITSRVLSRLSLEDLGVRFQLGPPQILLLVAAIGPMVLMAPAALVYISCFAKSFKEAQGYTAFVVLGAAVPGVASAFFPIGNAPWMQAVPVLGQYALGTQVLSGVAPSPVIFVGAALEAAAVAGVFLWLTARLFASEKMIFGRG